MQDLGAAALTQHDIENLRNELHRHQDDDREDFKAVRADTTSIRAEIANIRAEISEWTGGVKLLKFMAVVTVPSALAAAGAAIFNLIRHW